MIDNGVLSKKSSGGGVPNPVDFLYLIEEIYYAIGSAITSWKKILIRQNIQTKPCFGYEFPFTGVKDVDRKKKKTKFKLKYEYDDKGENKTKIVKFQFVPARLIEEIRSGDKSVYKERRDKFLSKFHELLIQS